jgi:hypothetical protein
VGDPLALRRHLPRGWETIWTNEPAQRGSAPLSRLAISPRLIFATLLILSRLIFATLSILSRLILLPLPLALRLIPSTLLRLVLRPPITG